MPDLTPVLVIIAIALGVGGFFLFQRQRKKDEPAPVPAPVPVAAPAPDVVALQAALKQAIDKLHASTPAVPVAAPAPPPAPAVALQPDGTIPAAFKPSPWPQNAGAVTTGAAEWTGDFDPADKWFKPGDLGYATRDEMYAGRNAWLYKREQAALLAKYGYNAEHPYVTQPE